MLLPNLRFQQTDFCFFPISIHQMLLPNECTCMLIQSNAISIHQMLLPNQGFEHMYCAHSNFNTSNVVTKQTGTCRKNCRRKFQYIKCCYQTKIKQSFQTYHCTAKSFKNNRFKTFLPGKKPIYKTLYTYTTKTTFCTDLSYIPTITPGKKLK